MGREALICLRFEFGLELLDRCSRFSLRLACRSFLVLALQEDLLQFLLYLVQLKKQQLSFLLGLLELALELLDGRLLFGLRLVCRSLVFGLRLLAGRLRISRGLV